MCIDEQTYTSIVFNEESILKIIKALDVNKAAHGHDDISIRMIKLCDKSIILAISLIYKNCINSGIVPNIWKKSNVVPVHMKGGKEVVDNYRPVLLLPVFPKILERLIFNSLFEFLHENNMFNENQSGFRPSDLCQYQLLSIVHDIYASFDCNPPCDARGVFLDISKAFDRVWDEVLIYKIKRNGVTGLPLKLI